MGAVSITEENLTPGQSTTGSANYTITQEDLESGFVTNSAYAKGKFNKNNVTSNTDNETVTGQQNPTFSINKSADPTTYDSVGQIITYTYNITNSGNVNITGPIKVVDNKTGTINVTEENLIPGQSILANATYIVTQEDLNAGSITNSAFATGIFGNNTTVSNTENKTVIAGKNASCNIDKIVTNVSGKGAFANVTKAGDVISYQINVTNTGNVNLTNVTLSDSLIIVSGPLESLNTNGVLEIGETWIYTGTYTVALTDIYSNGGGDGFIENTATVDCEQLEPISDSAQVPIQKKPVDDEPSCIIDKTVIDVAGKGPTGTVTETGQVITYEIAVANDGNVGLKNVTVADTLIENLTGPVESINSDGILEVDEIWTYTGTYTVTQADINSNGNGDGFIENTAIVECDQTEPDSDTAKVPIGKEYEEEKPDCIIEKTVVDVAGKGPTGIATNPGDKIEYQVIVKNTGNLDLTNVVISDSLIELTGPVETSNPDAVLEIGKTWTYTGKYVVTQEDISSNGAGDGFIENTATFDCDQLSPKSDSAQVPIEKEYEEEKKPAYCISKSIIGVDETGDCIVNEPGDVIKYRIIVKNEGNVDLTELSVKDALIELTGPKGDNVDPGILNVRETWKFFGEYTVTQTDIDINGNGNGFIENTATVSCKEIPEQKCSAKQPILQKTELCIYKSVIGIDETGDCIINKPGEMIQYQVIIKNEGKVDLTGISVKDSLIELARPVGDEINPGILNPGEIWKYSGNYAVTEEEIITNGNGNGFIENTVTVSCNELPDQTSTAKQQIFFTPNDDKDNKSEPGTGDTDGKNFEDEKDSKEDSQNNGNNGGSSGGNSNSNSGNSHKNGGSSKGSSSGISASPEPANNVEVKETAQAFITNEKNVKFDFANNKTCVLYISFDAKKTLGKTKATVEMLKGKSELVSQMPADQTYKCFNIWIGNNGVVTKENIQNAIICFKVEKEWAESKKIDQESIILNRYNNGKWDKLETSISEEDEKYLYLTAKTQGFSPFAITAKTIKENTQKENEDKIDIEPKAEGLEQNNANTKGNTQKQKENTKTPGFNAIFTIATILTVALHKNLHKKK